MAGFIGDTVTLSSGLDLYSLLDGFGAQKVQRLIHRGRGRAIILGFTVWIFFRVGGETIVRQSIILSKILPTAKFTVDAAGAMFLGF